MIGVDLGASFTKCCFKHDDGRIEYKLIPTKLSEIEKYFECDKEMNVIANSLPEGLKKWCVIGGGAHKFHDFFDMIKNRPVVGDELSLTAKAAAYLLTQTSVIHQFGAKHPVSKKFVMASMGTGVSFTLVNENLETKHIGGSSLGGGTLLGLSKLITGITDFKELVDSAAVGTNALDLTLSDIYGSSYGPTLSSDICASNFAKAALIEDLKPSKNDIAASLISTICYSVGNHVAGLCKAHNVDTIVFVGGFLATEGQIPHFLEEAVNLFSPEITIVIPENHQFVGALGAVLSIMEENDQNIIIDKNQQ